MIDDQLLQLCFIGVIASILQRSNERLDLSYKEITGEEFSCEDIKNQKIIKGLRENIDSLEKLKEANAIAKRALNRMQSSLEML